jgi:hypothetical protein
MQKQAMPKSYALLWFYDVFFCHPNPLQKEKEFHDVEASEEEYAKDPWERRYPNEDRQETLEHFITYKITDYRPRFAKKCGKSLRELRLYEKEIKAFEAWSDLGKKNASDQPWYYALLDLFDRLYHQQEIKKKDCLAFYGLQERTFKRYLATIRGYESGRGRNEFALSYDAKRKIYHFGPSGYPSPIIKPSNYKSW